MGSRQTICDWCIFNDFEKKDVLSHLERIVEPMNTSRIVSKERINSCMTADEAWAQCATSLCIAIPELSDEIARVSTDAPRCLAPNKAKHPMPFTYDLGHRKLPFVSLHYQGCVADLLTMAHEFGHAVQIVASWKSGKGQMPPVAREWCAFISELAILQFNELSSASICSAYNADDNTYFGAHKSSLEAALLDGQRQYQYAWNYPLARYFSQTLFQRCKSTQLSKIYAAGANGGRMLNKLAAEYFGGHPLPFPTKRQNSDSVLMKNYFPEIPTEKSDLPAIEAYRTLGMMTYLDLDYLLGHSEMSISKYYNRLLHHLQTQTAYVVIGDENKPIGYATWNESDQNPEHVEFTRQAAPFGDHLRLQRSLKRRLPHAKTASSKNERSARQAQIAW
ncbi:hypothetical protein AN476_18830 [Phaeobacter sp. 11ANDIMAR09]|nr:hypothetical protein AN476_18830 [Phaeobacter sp. 11ANDIMAR09]